jgi:hypothetical protein
VTGIEGATAIELVNTQGHVLSKKEYISDTQIDITNIPSGLYYVIFTTQNGITTRSFVVQ